MGVLVIFPIAAAIAVLCKKKFEETVFPAIGVIVLTLISLGMIGILKAGVYLALALTIGSIVILVIRRAEIKEYVLTPGFIAFPFLLVFFLIFSYGRYFSTDEEFSLYGPVVRILQETGDFHTKMLYYNLHTPFPFATLWGYFCTYTIGDFKEWMCIYANDIFILSAIIPIFRMIRSVKDDFVGWLLTILICVLLPIFKIPYAYGSFDMAVPQAAALIYTFAMLWSVIYESAWTVDSVFLAYGFLASCTLTKYGVYATIPLILATLSVSFYNRKKRKYLLLATTCGCLAAFPLNIIQYAFHEISLPEMFRIPIVYGGALLFAWIMVKLITYYRKGHHVLPVAAGFLIGALVIAAAAIILKNSEFKDYVTEEMIEYTNKLLLSTDEEEYYVIGKRVIPLYDGTILFLTMILSGIICGRIRREDEEAGSKARKANSMYVLNFSVTTGMVLYLVILGVLFITKIMEPKANPIPSIANYTAPALMLAIVVLFAEAMKLEKKKTVMLVAAIFMVICVYSDPVNAIFNKPVPEEEYPVITACKEQEVIDFKGTDRVFYIDPDLLEPVPKSFVWSVFPAGADAISGLYYNPDPIKWSEIERTMTPEELADLIKEGEYTYVYIKSADDFFITQFYPDFDNWGEEIRDNAIYRVEYNEEGQLQIKFIAKLAETDDGEEEE